MIGKLTSLPTLYMIRMQELAGKYDDVEDVWTMYETGKSMHVMLIQGFASTVIEMEL
jgi:hypothetical protein